MHADRKLLKILSNSSVIRTWPRQSVLENVEKSNSKVVGKCGSDVARLRQTGSCVLRRVGIFLWLSSLIVVLGAAAAICTIFPCGGSPIC